MAAPAAQTAPSRLDIAGPDAGCVGLESMANALRSSVGSMTGSGMARISSITRMDGSHAIASGTVAAAASVVAAIA